MQASSLFLVPPQVKRVETICSAPYQQGPYDPERKYVSHPVWREGGTTAGEETRKEEVCCWHDTYPIEGHIFHIPITTAIAKGPGWGDYCSLACMKRWIIERPQFNTPQLLTQVAQMARDRYGIVGPIKVALPQSRLKRFRGDMDIGPFRAWGSQGEIDCTVYYPPFVTWSMVYEERRLRKTAATVPAPSSSSSSSSSSTEVESKAVPMDTGPLVLPAFPEPSRTDREPIQIRGLRVPDPQSALEVAPLDVMDGFPTAAAQWDGFVQTKRQEGGVTGLKTPPVRGTKTTASSALPVSSMKTPAPKRQKTTHQGLGTDKKGTKTTTAHMEVEVPKAPSNDTKRGSLKAFMKQKTVKAQATPGAAP